MELVSQPIAQRLRTAVHLPRRARRGLRQGLLVVSAAALAGSLAAVQPLPASAAVPSTVGTAIANLANANVGKHCGDTTSKGTAGFKLNGFSACSYQWCSIFAGWVWDYADSRVDVAGLDDYARSFDSYGSTHGTASSTPHVGDAVTFVNSSGTTVHVSIVYSIGSGTVTVIGGNMNGSSPTTSVVAKYTINSAVGSSTGTGQYVKHYISPVFLAPTNLFVTLSNPATHQVSVSWNSSYNPGSFTITGTPTSGSTVTATVAGTARQTYMYAVPGTWTFKVCAVTSGATTVCSSIKYTSY